MEYQELDVKQALIVKQAVAYLRCVGEYFAMKGLLFKKMYLNLSEYISTYLTETLFKTSFLGSIQK